MKDSRRHFIGAAAGAAALASLPLKNALAQAEPPNTISNDVVKGEKANTRRQYSSTSSIIMSTQPSLTGGVARPGVSSTSQSSWTAAIWRPSRCAVCVART